jgi:UrcA family protein
MTPLTLTLAAIGLAGTAITPTIAAGPETMTADVQYRDLNLATPEGQAQLDRRLEKAVRTVCQSRGYNGGSRIPSADAKACLAKARSDVRQQVATLMTNERRGG